MTRQQIRKLLEEAEMDFRWYMSNGLYASAMGRIYRLQDDLGGLEGGVYLPTRSWTGFKNAWDHPEGMVPRKRLLRGGFHRLFTHVLLWDMEIGRASKRLVRIRK